MDIEQLLKPLNLRGVWRRPIGEWWKELPPGILNIYCVLATPRDMHGLRIETLARAIRVSSMTATYKRQQHEVMHLAEVLSPAEFYAEIYSKNASIRQGMGQWRLTTATKS